MRVTQYDFSDSGFVVRHTLFMLVAIYIGCAEECIGVISFLTTEHTDNTESICFSSVCSVCSVVPFPVFSIGDNSCRDDSHQIRILLG